MNLELLSACGIDCQAGIARCLGDTGIYETILGMFLEDPTMESARAALAKGDFAELFNCVHTMKGISGNASMTELYRLSCSLTELLRGGCRDEAAVRNVFSAFEAAYQKVRDGVSAALEK